VYEFITVEAMIFLLLVSLNGFGVSFKETWDDGRSTSQVNLKLVPKPTRDTKSRKIITLSVMSSYTCYYMST
jgi:hypothetical protein